jgi:hypothetical protein
MNEAVQVCELSKMTNRREKEIKKKIYETKTKA